MTAAGRRDVGEHQAAAAAHQAGDGPSLSADLGREVGVTFMIVLSSTVMNVAASAGRIQVERQHAPGSRGRIEYRHCAGLARRLIRQRPGMTRGVSAAAIARDPDMRRPGQRRRDRAPYQPSASRRIGGMH
ncbi:MAG: hypothetical protein ACRDOH_22320, partial [Streptosporangiaceae bacterium]